MARHIQATLPNGRIVKRETERPYTHVIAAWCSKRQEWFAYRWTMNLDKALKELRTYGGNYSKFTPCPTSVAIGASRQVGTKRKNWHVIWFRIPECADKHVRQINDMCRYARSEIWVGEDDRSVRLTFKSFKPEEIIARAKTFGWTVIE